MSPALVKVFLIFLLLCATLHAVDEMDMQYDLGALQVLPSGYKISKIAGTQETIFFQVTDRNCSRAVGELDILSNEYNLQSLNSSFGICSWSTLLTEKNTISVDQKNLYFITCDSPSTLYKFGTTIEEIATLQETFSSIYYHKNYLYLVANSFVEKYNPLTRTSQRIVFDAQIDSITEISSTHLMLMDTGAKEVRYYNYVEHRFDGKAEFPQTIKDYEISKDDATNSVYFLVAGTVYYQDETNFTNVQELDIKKLLPKSLFPALVDDLIIMDRCGLLMHDAANEMLLNYDFQRSSFSLLNLKKWDGNIKYYNRTDRVFYGELDGGQIFITEAERCGMKRVKSTPIQLPNPIKSLLSFEIVEKFNMLIFVLHMVNGEYNAGYYDIASGAYGAISSPKFKLIELLGFKSAVYYKQDNKLFGIPFTTYSGSTACGNRKTCSDCVRGIVCKWCVWKGECIPAWHPCPQMPLMQFGSLEYKPTTCIEVTREASCPARSYSMTVLGKDGHAPFLDWMMVNINLVRGNNTADQQIGYMVTPANSILHDNKTADAKVIFRSDTGELSIVGYPADYNLYVAIVDSKTCSISQPVSFSVANIWNRIFNPLFIVNIVATIIAIVILPLMLICCTMSEEIPDVFRKNQVSKDEVDSMSASRRYLKANGVKSRFIEMFIMTFFGPIVKSLKNKRLNYDISRKIGTEWYYFLKYQQVLAIGIGAMAVINLAILLPIYITQSHYPCNFFLEYTFSSIFTIPERPIVLVTYISWFLNSLIVGAIMLWLTKLQHRRFETSHHSDKVVAVSGIHPYIVDKNAILQHFQKSFSGAKEVHLAWDHYELKDLLQKKREMEVELYKIIRIKKLEEEQKRKQQQQKQNIVAKVWNLYACSWLFTLKNAETKIQKLKIDLYYINQLIKKSREKKQGSGRAFVCFESAKEAQECVQKYKKSKLRVDMQTEHLNSTTLTVTQAPIASEVLWHNLGYTKSGTRLIIVNILFFVLLGISFGFQLFSTSFRIHYDRGTDKAFERLQNLDLDVNFTEVERDLYLFLKKHFPSVVAGIMQLFLPTQIIFNVLQMVTSLLNTFFSNIIYYATLFEAHVTEPSYRKSLLSRIIFQLLFNSLFIPFFCTSIFATLVKTYPTTSHIIFSYDSLYSLSLVLNETFGLGLLIMVLQSVGSFLYHGYITRPRFDYNTSYCYATFIFLFTLYVGSIMPLVTPLAMLYMLYSYYLNRWTLLYFFAKAENKSGSFIEQLINNLSIYLLALPVFLFVTFAGQAPLYLWLSCFLLLLFNGAIVLVVWIVRTKVISKKHTGANGSHNEDIDFAAYEHPLSKYFE